MTKEEREIKQEALKIYCRQDTWAMVEILASLRSLSNDCKNQVSSIV